MITYENKGYDRKTYPKLVLNRLKGNGRFYPYLYPIGDLGNSKKVYKFS
jgi:hypothetical protein